MQMETQNPRMSSYMVGRKIGTYICMDKSGSMGIDKSVRQNTPYETRGEYSSKCSKALFITKPENEIPVVPKGHLEEIAQQLSNCDISTTNPGVKSTGKGKILMERKEDGGSNPKPNDARQSEEIKEGQEVVEEGERDVPGRKWRRVMREGGTKNNKNEITIGSNRAERESNEEGRDPMEIERPNNIKRILLSLTKAQNNAEENRHHEVAAPLIGLFGNNVSNSFMELQRFGVPFCNKCTKGSNLNQKPRHYFFNGDKTQTKGNRSSDLNLMLTSNEKKGGAPFKNVEANILREAFQYCGFYDMGYTGYEYTWSNNRSGRENVQERLDRFFANNSWKNIFPGSYVSHLSKRRSDHIPILMNVKGPTQKSTRKKRRKIFRFEEKWVRDESINDIIESAWNMHGDVKEKISQTASKLSTWSKATFGNFSKEMRE
ncbi:Triosephosphate isomerase [Bienertia sinuspersici]